MWHIKSKWHGGLRTRCLWCVGVSACSIASNVDTGSYTWGTGDRVDYLYFLLNFKPKMPLKKCYLRISSAYLYWSSRHLLVTGDEYHIMGHIVCLLYLGSSRQTHQLSSVCSAGKILDLARTLDLVLLLSLFIRGGENMLQSLLPHPPQGSEELATFGSLDAPLLMKFLKRHIPFSRE